MRRADTRRRRRTRRLAVLAATAALVVGTGAAFGGRIAGLFHGTPAPSSVQQGIRDITAPDPIKQIIGERTPRAVAVRTHGLIALRLPDGAVYLWGAPLSGGGRCIVLTQGKDPGSSRALHAICQHTWRAPEPKIEATLFGGTYGGELVLGFVRGPATSAELRLANGAPRPLPLVERAFLAPVPRGAKPVAVVARDANGAVTGRVSFLPAPNPPGCCPPKEPIALSDFKPLFSIDTSGGQKTLLIPKTPRSDLCIGIEQVYPGGRDTTTSCGFQAQLVQATLWKLGPDAFLLYGHVREGAALELRFSNAPVLQIPLHSGYFLLELRSGRHPSRYAVRDDAGRILGTQPFDTSEGS